MTQPNQSNKKPTRNVSRVGDVISLYHTEGQDKIEEILNASKQD